MEQALKVKHLGLVDYRTTWDAMQRFTKERDKHTQDEVWLLEHQPVFSQGQAGKAEHILSSSSIPVVQSDRGGQVTYHGPGQLVAYVLLDLKRNNMGVRALVTHIENAVIQLLSRYAIQAAARADAPGVYVDDKKIASLGLRVRRGCSFHGVAINIATDLAPFRLINPCGYAGMEMVNMTSLVDQEKTDISLQSVSTNFAQILAAELGLAVLS